MNRVRLVMVGGFLGAGKTTSLLALSQVYHNGGLRVGLITNDQAADLVDTGLARVRGFRVEEVAGACFYCKFNELARAADRLRTEERPDILLAEPVGSCTDLAATVVAPLRGLHADRYSVAPYSVLVFPEGKRYFLSSDTITTVNSSEAMFLRLDMPGHIKHRSGDTFSEIYLSYQGKIPASEFLRDFAPDERFLYLRAAGKVPSRMIRAYHLSDPATGREGPWLAGMTLDPGAVSEAWCHQRGYVCLIEEFGGRPIRPGQSFSAAFIVGFFDSIEEMHQVYDRHAGHDRLEVTPQGWKLLRPGA